MATRIKDTTLSKKYAQPLHPSELNELETNKQVCICGSNHFRVYTDAHTYAGTLTVDNLALYCTRCHEPVKF